jgi:hypothetical protein
MREEQEREVSQEKEEQRQIERPPSAVPLGHTLHDDVRTLVSTGLIPRNVTGITLASECLSQTTLKSFVERLETAAFSPHFGYQGLCKNNPNDCRLYVKHQRY